MVGVVVNEITIDTTMAVESVTANSRNKRPTMPPITGMGDENRDRRHADGKDGEADLTLR